MPVVKQLSLFGLEATPPAPADLAGLLAGAGQVVRMGGTARVSIVVGEQWRADALDAELRERGLDVTCVPTVDGNIGVRTAYASALLPLATAWLRGAIKMPPRGVALTGRALRLWAIAAGTADPPGYALRLGATDEPAWAAVGGMLADLGLAAIFLGPRAGGPAYRIVGRRRLIRLAEMVGDPPRSAPPGFWSV